MGRIFEKYGVNKMNLVYINKDDGYKTADLGPAAEKWLFDVRSMLVEALDNGVVYFHEGSKPKVNQFLKECGNLSVLQRELKEAILKGTLKVDAMHVSTQKELFGSYVLPWRPLCPVCYIFMYGGLYLKVRVARNDKLGIDVHRMNRTPKKTSY